jgi:hypothetical protein
MFPLAPTKRRVSRAAPFFTERVVSLKLLCQPRTGEHAVAGGTFYIFGLAEFSPRTSSGIMIRRHNQLKCAVSRQYCQKAHCPN